jgi:8-oxo-dGTP pyrophosphatase MutT (NUDIX family)
MDLKKEWKFLGKRTLNKLRIFNLRADRYALPRNKGESEFYVLESQDWVNVIPLLPSGEVVMVRQFRHGTREVTLEIPGGIVEPGCTPLEGARQELEEETGYRAEKYKYLGAVHPNPAFLDNACHTFLAQDLEFIGPPTPEDSESFEVVNIPLKQVPEMISLGLITHSLVVAAFCLLDFGRHWPKEFAPPKK